MDGQPITHGSLLKRVLAKFRRKSGGNPNVTRIRRRNAAVSLLKQRLPLLKCSLFLAGYAWMLAIPLPQLGQGTYIDENALQPSQVNTYWDWSNVHAADRYLSFVETLRDTNATSEQRAQFFKAEFQKLGILSSTQDYSFKSSSGHINGTNAYAVFASPRGSGTEAMVISASWLSRTGEGDGTLNLRGVSTVLALAGFLKQYSLWAKDIVFVISDGYRDGMQAWLNAYHGSHQSNLIADSLKLSSGVIWTALNIDYAGHSFSHLGLFFEGNNGRLPNQDLINSFQRISRYTGGVPVTVYDHIEPEEQANPSSIPLWIPEALRDIPAVKRYAYNALNVARHVSYQARGQSSGVHGLFHRFRIDALTIFAVPADGPHGFHAIGRIVESTLRTMNNLLERLHASFFFYILTGQDTFLKIGKYLPSVILISVAMIFHGLSTWVDAGWMQDLSSQRIELKSDGISSPNWVKRKRPVIGAVGIMAMSHLLGAGLFSVISTGWFFAHEKSRLIAMVTSLVAAPMMTLFIRPSPHGTASLSTVLKAISLCFASTVISITTVLNFSLAAFLAILLGVPLSISSSSNSIKMRLLRYAGYAFLALGWLPLCSDELQLAIWNWEVLGVWFAPFICMVYVPLLLQAGIVCLLPPGS